MFRREHRHVGDPERRVAKNFFENRELRVSAPRERFIDSVQLAVEVRVFGNDLDLWRFEVPSGV